MEKTGFTDFYEDQSFVDGCIESACYLSHIYHGLSHQTSVNVTKRSSMLKWYTTDNIRVVNPIPINFLRYTDEEIDMFTLESDNLSYFGGIISGSDEEDIILPCIDFTDCNTTLNEFLTMSFLIALKDDLPLARSYLQTAFMLMKLYSHRLQTDRMESNQMTNLTIQPFEIG